MPKSQKSPLSPTHKNAVSKARQITVRLITILDECIKNRSFDENWLWGDKETAVSVLAKLTQNLIKLIEMERGAKITDATDDKPLSDDDIDILKRYLKGKGS